MKAIEKRIELLERQLEVAKKMIRQKAKPLPRGQRQRIPAGPLSAIVEEFERRIENGQIFIYTARDLSTFRDDEVEDYYIEHFDVIDELKSIARDLGIQEAPHA